MVVQAARKPSRSAGKNRRSYAVTWPKGRVRASARVTPGGGAMSTGTSPSYRMFVQAGRKPDLR